MKDFFSIGELAKYQNISKQTLIFYDKIGLFRPAFQNPETGYRYYSARQLDLLDTILIMKKIGLSLEEIKGYLNHRSAEYSQAFLQKQLDVIGEQIRFLTLIQSRVQHKCQTLQEVRSHLKDAGLGRILRVHTPAQSLLTEPVASPCSLTEISIATKKCFSRAFEQNLPIFFETGVIVPRTRLEAGEYVRASHAFLPIEETPDLENVRAIPEGDCVVCYYQGEYLKIGSAYERIFDYCRKHRLEILSDSYEFCIHDHITARREDEYITKILFYVR